LDAADGSDANGNPEGTVERINVAGLSTPPGYSHAVVASEGRLVVTAGAVPLDPDGNLVGSEDYVAQTRQVLDNLALALEAAGAKTDDVLKTTVYVVTEDRADLASVWQVVQESGVAAAASTLLGVMLLGYEDQLVEIEAIAVSK
jgi:enamine deaminase RidA (YjgF/YER057c/UK114 family)